MSDYTLPAIAVAAAAFLVFKWFSARPRMTPDQALAAVKAGDALFVDVREPVEWSDGVIHGAELLPLSDLRGSRKRWSATLQRRGKRRLLLYCHSGMRSAHAASLLRREGVEATNIGGFGALAQAGLPVRKRVDRS